MGLLPLPTPDGAHSSWALETGSALCLAVGSREHQRGENWGAYTVDETALRHGAGVEEETTDRAEAYAQAPKAEWTSYQEGWLPS